MVLALLGCSGCGYHQGGLYPREIQTVAVPIFENKSYQTGLEMTLSKAVINRIEGHSPWKVVSRDKADAILEGEITATNIRTLSRDYQTNLPREQQMTFTVNFLLKDLRSGRMYVQRRDFSADSVYYPSLGEDSFVGSQRVIERLALAIVQELQADW